MRIKYRRLNLQKNLFDKSCTTLAIPPTILGGYTHVNIKIFIYGKPLSIFFLRFYTSMKYCIQFFYKSKHFLQIFCNIFCRILNVIFEYFCCAI